MKKTKIFIIAAALLLLSAPALAQTASSYVRNINATFGLTVTLEGQPIEWIDSNGKKVDAFVFEDTAYVPLKTLAPILGASTQYVFETNSVNITRNNTANAPVSEDRLNSYLYIINTLNELYDKGLIDSKANITSGSDSEYLEYIEDSIKQLDDVYQDNFSSDIYSDIIDGDFYDRAESSSNISPSYTELNPDLLTDYYNTGKNRLDEINNGTANNQSAWLDVYESMGDIAVGGKKTTASTDEVDPDDLSFPLHVYSNDGKVYLGKCVTDRFDDDSIWYPLEIAGDYSSRFSNTSIWNELGEYGGTSSFYDKSAFNAKAKNPPIIVDNNGVFVAYLTNNSDIENGWTITELKQFVVNNGQ